MKIIKAIVKVLHSAYSFDASPNMFGSKNRAKEKKDVAEKFDTYESDTQEDIAKLENKNPFESAAAKSAMAKASANARQMQQKNLNTMGTGATAEALIASQGNVNQAMGNAAGQIATGAEANKNIQLNALRGRQDAQRGQSANLYNSAADEIGSGWGTLFQGISALGQAASGAGQGINAFRTANKTTNQNSNQNH